MTGAPYALPEDLANFDKARYTVLRSYTEYLENGLEREQHPKDHLLHLGLLPQPWCGDLRSATAFILLLNPGLNPGDYFGEYCVRSYKQALVDNLQSTPKRQYPFLFLDPEFSWHPGARYWRARLDWLVRALRDQRGTTYREALGEVARKVCCIQLVPYHSAAFRLPRGILKQLPSADMSRTFVKEDLARRKGVLIIVTRQWRRWGLPEGENHIIKYEGSETRAAYLPERSEAGRALKLHFRLHDD